MPVSKKGRIHTMKWERCVRKVRKRSRAVNPFAVCTAALGKESYLKSHRKNNPSKRPIPPIPKQGHISYLLSDKSRKLSSLEKVW